MQYSIFDWDNTVRSGFTLFQWIDFLCKKNLLSEKLREERRRLMDEYKAHRITHDTFAHLSCDAYAAELKGVKESYIDNLLDEYIEQDRNSIFPFAGEVFSLLTEHNIDIIIVSGAPERILKRYAPVFGIKEVYAVSEQVKDGIFTGEIKSNAGYKKKKIVEKLMSRYGKEPILGFGDSESDVPILEAAKHGIRIQSKVTTMREGNYEVIDCFTEPGKVREKILNLIG